MARDGYRPLLIKSVLFLGFLQQLHEEWMVDVDHRDNEPLLLLPLPHQDRQTPLGDVFQFLLLVLVVVKMKMRNMDVEVQMVFVSNNPHFAGTPRNLKTLLCTKQTGRPRFHQESYNRRREKGQGSDAEMARLKRVREESVKDLGILLMIYVTQTQPTYAQQRMKEDGGFWQMQVRHIYSSIWVATNFLGFA